LELGSGLGVNVVVNLAQGLSGTNAPGALDNEKEFLKSFIGLEKLSMTFEQLLAKILICQWPVS
jgi:hypothetical protein